MNIDVEIVFSEVLRKYPPLPFIFRECVRDYKIPKSELILEKGSTVLIPIKFIHYDNEYYKDPEKFAPERFNPKSKNTNYKMAHFPFGEGRRSCPGN